MSCSGARRIGLLWMINGMIIPLARDPVVESVLQGDLGALLLHHGDRHLGVHLVHLHGNMERAVSEEDADVRPVAGDHVEPQLGHSLSPLPPKAALTVVPQGRVIGTEVDYRVCLAVRVPKV